MGFFSDLKQDLSQAVNELIPDEEQIKTGDEEEKTSVSLDEMLENIDAYRLPEELKDETADDKILNELQDAETEETIETVIVPEEALESNDVITSSEEEVQDAEVQELLQQMLTSTAEAEQEPVEVESKEVNNEKIENKETRMMEVETENRIASDETSVITRGMIITGDIISEGSIDVVGTVNGNIDALGKLNITGHVNGNSKAAEIYAESAKINGEVVSEGAVKIGASSVIIGNIFATSAAIAGAVKGDIDVKGPVVLDASAIVMGNIRSKSVQINNGAVIEGMCSQCYADVSPTSFFDDYKPEITKGKSK